MLEPRYPSPGPSMGATPPHRGLLEAAAQMHAHNHHLETAVDLSRKSVTSEIDVDEVSDDDAPLDLKVRPSEERFRGDKPNFAGFSSLPGPQQRAELLRIAEIYTSVGGPPSNATPIPPDSRESSQERADTCQYCGTSTRNTDFVPADHQEGLCNRGSIACTLCAKTFTLYSHYEAHKKCHQKLKQRQYPCQTCGKVFTSASNRNMHQRIHKGVRPFQCAPCGVFFRQKAHLQKHQKTQGHIQASEIYEKKRKEGLISEDTNTVLKKELEDEDVSLQSAGGTSPEPVVDSTQSPSSSPNASGNGDPDSSPSSTVYPNRARSKSSPKRKQARPQYLSKSEEEDDQDDLDHGANDKVRSFIDYNDITHGYECRQCAFSSHDLSVLKEHVREEHMSSKEEVFRCSECQITFSKEFNLKIHNRKHETSSQFLPCDFCEQVFKVPNKLIKHMEGVHCVCPNCGLKQEDKAALVRHQDEVHGEQRRGFHSNLLQFSPLNQLAEKNQAERRAAKMRKVDSLAEVIRQKQLRQQHGASTHSVSALNGNTIKSPLSSPTPRRRKTDMSAVKALLAKTPEPYNPNQHQTDLPKLPFVLNKISPMEDMLRKSENNNILSSLKLPPTIRLPTQPVAGLTPPSSPPPSRLNRPGQIRGEVSVTIVPTNGRHDDSENEETGLDLSIGSSRKASLSRSDENEVSTTARDDLPPRPDSSLFSRLPELSSHPASSQASSFPAFPFPFPGLLPPVPPGTDPALTEHLLKFSATLPRPPTVPVPPAELAKSGANLSHPYTVLSAMLGQPPYQPAFPGMSPGLFPSPTAAVASSPTPVPVEKESPRSIIPPTTTSTEPSKPFNCTFCSKEFSHLSSLESHMEHMHSGESKHMCDTCGKNFSSKSNLTAHKKIHSGERPFECQICHKRFRQKAHLQKHETTHSSATPYQCTMCDKAFGHISNLNTHMATHSNVRPYQCADCGKSYKDSASFKRHRLGHTGERPYPCALCSESFIDSKALRRHREVSHPTAAHDPELDSVGDEEDESGGDKNDSGSSSMDQSASDTSARDHSVATEANTSTSAYSSFEEEKNSENDEANNKS